MRGLDRSVRYWRRPDAERRRQRARTSATSICSSHFPPQSFTEFFTGENSERSLQKLTLASLVLARVYEWSGRESNPRPLQCDCSALPTELPPRCDAYSSRGPSRPIKVWGWQSQQAVAGFWVMARRGDVHGRAPHQSRTFAGGQSGCRPRINAASPAACGAAADVPENGPAARRRPDRHLGDKIGLRPGTVWPARAVRCPPARAVDRADGGKLRPVGGERNAAAFGASLQPTARGPTDGT